MCDDGFAQCVDPSAGGIALAGVPGSGTSSAPYQFPATTCDVLLAMGRATAAIASPTLARFVVSSHWSILRWYWAFDRTAAPTVALSDASDGIRFHHRQAFSEALGLGVGLLIVEQFAGGTSSPASGRAGPLLIDVESHLPHRLKARLRPDLLVLALRPGGVPMRVILECKGNSEDRYATIRQLRSGIEQARAVTGPAERIVVGACAPRTAPRKTFDAFGIRLPAGGTPGSSGASGTAIVDELVNNALESERRRILRFAGDDELTEGHVQEFEVGGVAVRGRRFVLRQDDRAVEIILGVIAELLEETTAAASIEDLHRARMDFARANSDGLESFSAEGQIHRVALAVDGCTLGVRDLPEREVDGIE